MKLRNALWFIVGLGLFIYLLSKVSMDEITGLVSGFNPIYVVPYIIISLLIFAGFVIRWKIILNLYHKGVSIIDLFLYKFAGYFISYVTPSAKIGGEGVRIYFLMKEKQITFDKAASSVIIDKIIEVNTNGLFVIMGILLFVISFSLPMQLMWSLIGLGAFIAILITIYYWRIFNNKPFFYPIMRFLRLHKIKAIRRNEIKIIEAEKKMVLFHVNHKKEFVLALGISIILLILTVLEFKVLTLMFGYSIPLYGVFIILTFIALAYIIPIPGALGVLEGGQVTIARVVGLGHGAGIAIALLTRVRDTLWGLIGFAYLYVKGIRYGDFIKKETSSSFMIDPRVNHFKKWKVK